MGQSIKAMGTCWDILLMICSRGDRWFISWVAPGRCWRSLSRRKWKPLLIGATSSPLSTVHAPEVPANLVAPPQFAQEVAPKGLSNEEQLCQLDALMNESREDEGLTLRDLALETRISTHVIEGLRRAWSDRLPERAYLAST